jgi:hypothetical protein
MPLPDGEVLNLSFMPTGHYVTRLLYLHITPCAWETPSATTFHFGDEFFYGLVTFLGVTEGTGDDDWDLLAGLTILPGDDMILCTNVVVLDT